MGHTRAADEASRPDPERHSGPSPAAAEPTRPPLPRVLQVEVTAACNLACRMCLVRYRPPKNRLDGAMTFETFTRLLDDVPDADDVTLQGLGEPLLSPHLLDMVREARRRGMTVGFNTNATLLTRRKAEALVEAGLSWLYVSLDGASAATYEGIRDGAEFDTVVENLRGLVAAKQAAASADPRLSLVFVAMRRNVGELADVVRLAGDLGVERVSVQNLSHSFDDAPGGYEQIRAFTSAEALWASDAPRVEEHFAAARAEAQALGVRLQLPRVEERPGPRRTGEPGCDWPWRATYVNHDGQVQPCCMVMGADRASWGNAVEDGFAQVWHGERAREFRAALLTDTPPKVCEGCSLYRGVF